MAQHMVFGLLVARGGLVFSMQRRRIVYGPFAALAHTHGCVCGGSRGGMLEARHTLRIRMASAVVMMMCNIVVGGQN